MLRGMAPEEAQHAEWRRGTLPPGQLGWRKATEIRDQSALLAEAALAYRNGRRRCRRRRHRPRRGRRLTGTVSPVFGDRLVSVTYSKLDGTHLLQSWIPLLALLAHDPSRDWAAVCIGRARKGTTPQLSTLRRPAESAVDLLADLVAMYDAGRREPLPLPIKTSYAWAEAVHTHGDPERAAGYRWKIRPLSRRGRGAGARAHVGPGRLADRSSSTRASTTTRGRLWLPMLRGDGRVMDNFDLLGPLPAARSTTVLEASAGTGKTFALAGLVTRYIAEGAATLDQMLLITFGRAATQELRERVRRQIVDAVVAFDDPSRAGDNQVIAHLLDCGEDERRSVADGCATRWPRSTPRPSPPHTSSASWCSSRSGWRATPTPA